jgi:hypothetical protein
MIDEITVENLTAEKFCSVVSSAQYSRLKGYWGVRGSGSDRKSGIVREGLIFQHNHNTHNYCRVEMIMSDSWHIEGEYTNSPRVVSSGNEILKTYLIFDNGRFCFDEPWNAQIVKILNQLVSELETKRLQEEKNKLEKKQAAELQAEKMHNDALSVWKTRSHLADA